MKKRIIFAALTILLIGIFLILLSSCFVYKPELIFSLNPDGNSYCVEQINSSEAEEIVIPETYKGKPVTTINIFELRKNTKKITIPKSIKEITCSLGSYDKQIEINYLGTIEEWLNIDFDSKFWSCAGTDLYLNGKIPTELVIPEGTQTVGVAFAGCDSIERVVLPESIIEIGEGAFSGCSNLKEINIPDSVTKIGDSAFHRCSSLEEINLPNSITEIGNGAFSSCTSLKKIIIPNQVSVIESSTFSNCTALEEITIPSSVTEIEMYAFIDCTTYKRIYLSDITSWINIWGRGKIELGGDFYLNGELITNLKIPDGVERIDADTFSRFLSIKSVYIPKSVEYIYGDAFYYCEDLEKITFERTSGWIATNSYGDWGYRGGEAVYVTNEEKNAESFKGGFYTEYIFNKYIAK